VSAPVCRAGGTGRRRQATHRQAQKLGKREHYAKVSIWDAYLREKRQLRVRPETKSGAKLAIICENEHF